MRFPSGRRLLVGALAVSLLGNLVMGGWLGYKFMVRGGIKGFLARQNYIPPQPGSAEFQVGRRKFLAKLPHSPGDTVFLGDSLIADGPWAELFTPVKNFGIGAEATVDILARLDPIVAHTPRAIVLLVGANDLAYQFPVDRVLANYEAILGKIREGSPKTKLVVIAVMPSNPKIGLGNSHDTPTAREINRRLEELVRRTPEVTYLDFWPMLADGEGNLLPEYTTDGVHLNVDAYLAIAPRVREAIGPVFPAAAEPAR